MAARHHPYTLRIERFIGERSVTHSKTDLATATPADAWRVLEAVRSALPPCYGAGLTDRYGNNVRATDTVATE